jgi:hypothetical protein
MFCTVFGEKARATDRIKGPDLSVRGTLGLVIARMFQQRRAMSDEIYKDLIARLFAEQRDKEEHRLNTEAQRILLREFLDEVKSKSVKANGRYRKQGLAKSD